MDVAPSTLSLLSDPTVLMGIGGAVLAIFGVLGWWVVSRRARALRAALDDDAPDAQLGESSAPAPLPAPTEPGAAARFFLGLARSRAAISKGLSRVLGGGDDEAFQELEDALVGADVGVRAAMDLTEAVRHQSKGADLRGVLRDELLRRVGESVPIHPLPAQGPLAILVVGVNGSGKTTTIGKLAARYVREGRSVMLSAGDTFRAGAIDQLKVWGERSGATVIAHQEGADPAAVTYDALQAAQARGVDVLICDTAGRLQARKPLMDELGKVVRVMGKALPGAPHEVLLVLDATIGQNALSQARVFKEVVGVTGVALTKLDGTARGGVVVAVNDDMGLPVKLVGLGEGVDDLRDFDPEPFVDALLGVQAQPA